MTLRSILATVGLADKPMPTGSKTLTGVSGELIARHRDRQSGEVHQHSWLITVWMSGENDARSIRLALDNWISRYEGKVLPDRIGWAEDMAGEIAACLTDHSGYHGYAGSVREVVIERPFERLLARWSAQ